LRAVKFSASTSVLITIQQQSRLLWERA